MIIKNRKASHDYYFEETLEVGIQLKGTEIKSVTQGQVNLKDGFVRIINGELILSNVHISPYDKGNIWNIEPVRDRKLLAHKREIKKWAKKVQLDGYTIIPVDIHFTNGKAKMLIALAKGKKNYDKRQSLKDKTQKREIQKEFKKMR